MLEEIEKSKKIAMDKYKADEMKRLQEEREKIRKDREARELELERAKNKALQEPDDGMLTQVK